MKFLEVFVVATALGLLGIQIVTGQECDAETNATLVDELNERQSLLKCVFGLRDNYTFKNENENVALAAIATYNESAFAAVEQGDCSALNESLSGILGSLSFFGYTVELDSTAIKSGLFAALARCILPNETCDVDYLNYTLYLAQYAVGCYLTLANGSYQLTDDQAEYLDLLSALNDTAVYAAIANQCDTLNATLVQIGYITNLVAELIYNGSDTNVSDALTMCLFPEPTCSVNGTLISIQTKLSCIISLSSSFVLNDSLVGIVNALVNQNWTAFNASNDNDCDTLDNATATILELIQNFTDLVGNSTDANDTGLAAALNNCLNGNETCSIKDLNTTLDRWEPVLDCLCDLEESFNLMDVETDLLYDADHAFVKACLAVEEEDNCTVVSDDVQLFHDAIQEFVDYVTSNNESSVDFVNAVNDCANLSSMADD